MKTVKKTRLNQIKNTILNLWKLDYKKKRKTKLKLEEQRRKEERNCSLYFGPKKCASKEIVNRKFNYWCPWKIETPSNA
jgi:hypothetical protein